MKGLRRNRITRALKLRHRVYGLVLPFGPVLSTALTLFLPGATVPSTYPHAG